jgi:hypothetical protein
MPGKEKKNAGVWLPVPPDRPSATNNKGMTVGAVLPTLGRTFRPDQWENTDAEEKFQGNRAEEKKLSLYRNGEKYSISCIYLKLQRIGGGKKLSGVRPLFGSFCTKSWASDLSSLVTFYFAPVYCAAEQ